MATMETHFSVRSSIGDAPFYIQSLGGKVMIYSTTRCPHCKALVRSQTNPVFEIACPFEKCPSCNNIYKNTYKEEWITKSPIKRFFFFIGNGTWARALLLPLAISAIVFGVVGIFWGVSEMKRLITLWRTQGGQNPITTPPLWGIV